MARLPSRSPTASCALADIGQRERRFSITADDFLAEGFDTYLDNLRAQFEAVQSKE